MIEQLRLEERLQQQELSKRKFKPSLNQKSHDLAVKNRTVQLQEIQQIENELNPLSHRNPQVEDLLIMKGRQAREKVIQMRANLVNSEV